MKDGRFVFGSRPERYVPQRTEGTWRFEEGDPGFSGDFYEPPSEPYPPSIVATLEDSRNVEIAQLSDPIPESAAYDSESGEPERSGNANANGRLMAAAPELLEILQITRSYVAEMRVPVEGVDNILFEIDHVIKQTMPSTHTG